MPSYLDTCRINHARPAAVRTQALPKATPVTLLQHKNPSQPGPPLGNRRSPAGHPGDLNDPNSLWRSPTATLPFQLNPPHPPASPMDSAQPTPTVLAAHARTGTPEEQAGLRKF